MELSQHESRARDLADLERRFERGELSAMQYERERWQIEGTFETRPAKMRAPLNPAASEGWKAADQHRGMKKAAKLLAYAAGATCAIYLVFPAAKFVFGVVVILGVLLAVAAIGLIPAWLFSKDGTVGGLNLDNVLIHEPNARDASRARAELHAATTKKCPDCISDIPREAKVCRHCQHRFAA